MESFLVPAGFGEAELVEKRSRFIGRVWPAENEGEALALDAAGVMRIDMWDELLVSCNYSQYERVRRLLEKFGAVFQNSDFGADVMLEVMLPQTATEQFAKELTELTAATATCDTVGTSFRGVKLR